MTDKPVRVNIRTQVNTKNARYEKRNGRKVVIVPSATLPDDVVMNGIRYPAEEIEKSYMSLNSTPAPLGHPIINGEYASALHPEAINGFYVGAYNDNVKRKDGKVYLDKVIDIAFAEAAEGGQEVLNAIKKGEPIHTSTGLYCHLDELDNDDEADYSARDIDFDHDAILLNEEGAATPEDGVGIFVHSNGEKSKIKVINSYMEEQAMRELEWAADLAVRAGEQLERASFVDRIATALRDMVSPGKTEEETEMADKEQLDALNSKVDDVQASVTAAITDLGESIANSITEALKPVTDHITAVANQAKADEEKELEGLVNKIVKANLLDEESAKELPLSAARKLAANIKEPGKAQGIQGVYTNTTDDKDEFSDYDPNSHLDAKKEA